MPETSPSQNPVKRPVAWAALLIAAAGCLVYSNSFSIPFLFDDVPSIPDNPYLRVCWPLWKLFETPPQGGLAGRPIPTLSFAINYQLGGLNVWTYHAVNLFLHLLNGWLLFGIARRTLLRPPLSIRYGSQADGLSLTAALLWTIHPLATESVNYIVQRTELLMALFLLLALYGFLRSTVEDGRHSVKWQIASVAACGLGMLSKEAMASAPILVLLYDRTFISGSFQEALRRRSWVYAGLFCTWLILLPILLSFPRSDSVGFHFSNLTPWQYLLTQTHVILHYLRLAIWPQPLVLDYHDWPIARSFWEVALFVLSVAILFGLTVWATLRKSPLGFLGTWLFLILAPTSSVVPIVTEIVAERRMYLPLVAVVVGIVVMGWNLIRRLHGSSLLRQRVALGLVGIIGAGFGWMTLARNQDYRTEISIWMDAAAKRPRNPRAHNNLGLALANAGRWEEALFHCQKALALSPDYLDATINLGGVLQATGRPHEAISSYLKALQLKPTDARAHTNLANVLAQQGRLQEAWVHHQEALRLDPTAPVVHNNLGVLFMDLGRMEKAAFHFQEALRLKPEFPEAHSNLGMVQTSREQFDDALRHYQRAIQLKPDYVKVHNNLGNLLIHQGRPVEAVSHLKEAIRLKPNYAEAYNNLGVALSQQGRYEEAISNYKKAIELQPESTREIRENLEFARQLAGSEGSGSSASE